MAEPSFALRKAVLARLAADAALTALIGAGRVHDEVPRGRAPPYLVIGEGTVRDWSTSSERGHEHLLVLTAWSAAGGAREAFAIAAAAAASLEGLPALLDGHRLANLVWLGTEVRREAARSLVRATVRLRAATEVTA
jgi:hypothetical protein